MRTDEQLSPSLDPLDGFLISGTWTSAVPPRPNGLEEFLAPPPIPDDPKSTSVDNGETAIGAVTPTAVISEGARRETRSRPSMRDDRNTIAATAADHSRVEARVAESPPSSRAIAAETAALAVAEPQALVAPSDVFIEFVGRAHETNNGPVGEQSAALLGTLLEDGGLIDPSSWFSGGAESTSPSDSVEGATSSGIRRSRAPAGPWSTGFDRGRSNLGSDRVSTSIRRVDRHDESPREAFEEIEARLSRIAARLEEAADRIESTPSSPLTSRVDRFRGRVD